MKSRKNNRFLLLNIWQKDPQQAQANNNNTTTELEQQSGSSKKSDKEPIDAEINQ